MAINLDGDGLTTTGLINTRTAQNSTSGTSIDFTGIPAGTKRVTVMFNGVSTSGTSLIQVQIGTGGVATTSGYSGYYSFITTSTVSSGSTSTGFAFQSNSASNNISGSVQVFNITGNTWVANVNAGSPSAGTSNVGGGSIALSGALNFVRITTVNGTDTFDAGSINILYE